MTKSNEAALDALAGKSPRWRPAIDLAGAYSVSSPVPKSANTPAPSETSDPSISGIQPHDLGTSILVD